MFVIGAQFITSNSEYKDEHDNSVDLNVQP